VQVKPEIATIQYHVRDYFGDARGLAVVQWLNARPSQKAKQDPVEQLIELNRKWKAGADVTAMTRKIRAILRRSELRLAPFFYTAIIPAMRFLKHRGRLVPRPMIDWRRWRIEWDATAKGMGQAQALALRSVLELAGVGLLGRVRKCKRTDCGQWFFGRKQSQVFHSVACQQYALRHQKEFMQRHAAVMRERRAAKKPNERGSNE
jgi:hypothetical protein